MELRKRRGRPTARPYVSDIFNLVDGSGQKQRLFKAGQRLHGALPIHPITVGRIDVKFFRGNWRQFPALAYFVRLIEALSPHFRRNHVVQALAILQNECIEIDQRADSLWDSIGHAACHAAAIGMAAQDYVRKFLPAEEIGDIRNVRIQIHVG